jgi:hypothetical protein
MFCVKLGGFCRVVGGMVQVTLRHVSVVSCCFVVVSFMMFGRFVMVPNGMFVMFCCLAMVFCCFLGHIAFSSGRSLGPRETALVVLT